MWVFSFLNLLCFELSQANNVPFMFLLTFLQFLKMLQFFFSKFLFKLCLRLLKNSFNLFVETKVLCIEALLKFVIEWFKGFFLFGHLLWPFKFVFAVELSEVFHCSLAINDDLLFYFQLVPQLNLLMLNLSYSLSVLCYLTLNP